MNIDEWKVVEHVDRSNPRGVRRGEIRISGTFTPAEWNAFKQALAMLSRPLPTKSDVTKAIQGGAHPLTLPGATTKLPPAPPETSETIDVIIEGEAHQAYFAGIHDELTYVYRLESGRDFRVYRQHVREHLETGAPIVLVEAGEPHQPRE